MNKKITILIIVLVTIFVLSIFGMFIVSVNSLIVSNSQNNKNNKLIEKVKYNKIKDINIKFDASDVEIIEKEINSIIIEFYLNKNVIHSTSEDSNTITIETKVISNNLINNKSPKIKIYLPRNYDKTININGDAGDIEVGKFPKMNLKANLDAADLEIDSLYNADINVDAGDIDIDNIYNLINLNCNASDVSINNLNISNNSNIQVDFGMIKIKKTNNVFIDTKIDVGEVKINNNHNNSKTTLLIKVNVGGIEVG